MVTAAELMKLVASAGEAARAAEGGGAPEQLGRALDILKQLAKAAVTAPLLKETEAGKRVNRLSKSSEPQVAAAAAAVVAAWKDAVKREAAEAPASSGGQQPLSRAPSFGTASTSDAGGGAEQPQQLSQQGSLPQQQQQQPQQQRSQQQPGPQRPISPAASSQQLKTGDPKRDKIRQLLAANLALVPPDERGGAQPGEVAAEVEAAIFARFGGTGPEYGAKVRSLSFNLKDRANPDLRARVLSGEVDPQRLVEMAPEELASEAKRRENEKIRQDAAAEAVRGQTMQASTDMFKCGRCKQSKCTYYQMQTRSADEPMTTFVTCVNCGNKWKFC